MEQGVPSVLRMLWTLMSLRHQLLRAQARTGAGRRALFIAGHVLGGSFILLAMFAGSAAALLSTLQEHGEETCRWILTGIWMNGAILNLLLGRDTRQSSLDFILRRYPLTRKGRLCLRHASGLLDPVWLFLSAATVGVAGGNTVGGPGAVLLVAPVALLFIGVCYLSSLVLLAGADIIMSRRGGGTIAGAAAFILFLAAGLLVVSTADPSNASWWHEADLALRLLPPGATAALFTGIGFPSGLLDIATLLLWFGFLASVLVFAEHRALSDASVISVSDCLGRMCDRIAGLFKSPLGPLVGKAMRCHLRCDRVRFSFAGTIPLVLLLPRFMSATGGPYMALLETAALMFLSSILATAAITLNQFGCDGDGVRRYWILPAPAVSALRAASIASLLLGAPLGLLAIAGLPLLAAFPLDSRALTILASSAAAGLFFFNSAGLWTSVLSPRRSNFRGVIGNELSFYALLLIGLGIALSLAAAFAVERCVPYALFPHSWWGFALAPILCASLYLISYRSVSTVMTARRELLIRVVSGADHT